LASISRKTEKALAGLVLALRSFSGSRVHAGRRSDDPRTKIKPVRASGLGGLSFVLYESIKRIENRINNKIITFISGASSH
jgi:hypothetical protein